MEVGDFYSDSICDYKNTDGSVSASVAAIVLSLDTRHDEYVLSHVHVLRSHVYLSN